MNNISFNNAAKNSTLIFKLFVMTYRVIANVCTKLYNVLSIASYFFAIALLIEIHLFATVSYTAAAR